MIMHPCTRVTVRLMPRMVIMQLRLRMAAASRERAQHCRSHRAPKGKQHCQQYQKAHTNSTHIGHVSMGMANSKDLARNKFPFWGR
jgi:hypothetical protein